MVGYVGFEAAGGCDWVMCEGGLVGAKNQKPSSRGSVLGRGYHNGVEYIGFEFDAAGGCDWMTCEGGLVGAKNQKLSSRGSVLARKY